MKLRSFAFAISLATLSLAALSGCGGTVEHNPQTSASALTKAPVAQNSHGVVKMMGDALGEVGLRTEQRAAIEKLAAEADARHQPMIEGRRELMLAFAGQIEAGAIDRAALQPKLDRVTADIEKARTDDRAALQKLHGLLDNDQRNAFVDALERQFKAKRGEHHGEKGERHARGPGGFAKMHHLAEELKLTDAQKEQIRDVMKEEWKEQAKNHDGMQKHRFMLGAKPGGGPQGMRAGKHALEAFREEKLDLDRVAPQHDVKATARMGTDAMTGFATKILPILTPEQRKLAAEKIRGMAQTGDAALLVH